MAILLTLDLPVSREELESVSDSMGVRTNPPQGLIAHIVTDVPGAAHVVDLWESAEDFQKFAEAQLMPAAQKILQEHGLSAEALAPTIVEGYDLVLGR
jgi:hypothetical protein